MQNTLSKEEIPLKDIYYFRQRFKNKIYQSTLAYFVEMAKERNLTKKDIARLLNKDPAQITRWFSGPNNWTLDTISDLLLSMDAELKYEIVSLHENTVQTTRNLITGENSARARAIPSSTQYRVPKNSDEKIDRIPLNAGTRYGLETRGQCAELKLQPSESRRHQVSDNFI